MESKIKRFIELSKEFTKDSGEVYEGFKEVSNGWIMGTCITGTNTSNVVGLSSVNYIGNHTNSQITESKAEQFEKSQLEKINKVKRYEEYLELQTSLSEYYNALEKLNNK